jgi:hypothetical protein
MTERFDKALVALPTASPEAGGQASETPRIEIAAVVRSLIDII